MSNLHAAGLPQLNIIDIPVAHLVAGQQIRYHPSEWTVTDVLPAHALSSYGVIGVDQAGNREILFYAHASDTAQVIAL